MTPRERLAAVRAVVLRGEFLLLVALIAVALGLAYAESAQQAGDVAQLDTYSTYDVKTGGYRAWYRLLQREGDAPATFERGGETLDAGTSTLVYAEPVAGDSRALAPTRADTTGLEAWVKAGGHLVYLGYDDTASLEGYLDLPGIVPSSPRSVVGKRGTIVHSIDQGVASRDRLDRWRAHFRVACACVVGPLRISPEWQGLGIRSLSPRTEVRLFAPYRHHVETLLADRRGAIAVRYRFGRGEVTEIADETLFDNGRLDVGDAGRLAYVVARPLPVAFDEVPHGYYTPERWWEVLPRPAVAGIALAALAILIAVVGSGVRLGPAVPLVPREPGSAEFLDSLAGLFQRYEARRASVEDAVRSVYRRIATSVGLTGTATPDEIAARLRSPQDLADFAELLAMTNAARLDDAALVRALTLAQRLRKDYAHGRSRDGTRP